MTVRPWRRHGQLIDLPGAMGQVGEQAGLVLFERNVALLTGLRDDGLVSRASFFALEHARKCRRRGVPQLVIAHEDVLVFRRPVSPARLDGQSGGRGGPQGAHGRGRGQIGAGVPDP